MIFKNGQLVSEASDAEVIREGMDEAEFVRLAEKYRHHDAEKCEEKACLICEGIVWIVNGQSDIAEAEYNKRQDYALDNGMVF